MTIRLENDIIDIMKTIMIAFLVLCFTATVGNTNDNIFNKIQTHINMEIENTKEFQKKGWQDGKDQIATTIATIKSWFVKE